MSEDQRTLLRKICVVLVVIEVRMRVDDHSYGLVRNLTDGLHNLGIENGEVVINDKQPVRTGLNLDVAPRSGDDVNFSCYFSYGLRDFARRLRIIDFIVEHSSIRDRNSRRELSKNSVCPNDYNESDYRFSFHICSCSLQ